MVRYIFFTNTDNAKKQIINQGRIQELEKGANYGERVERGPITGIWRRTPQRGWGVGSQLEGNDTK